MSSEQALNKKGWEEEEDVRLLELHASFGPNWTHIARGMGTKSAKQCRERYTQQLRPGLNRSPISEDEGRRIMEMVQESGQRWAQIARALGTNRSDNQVKNWWNGAKRKETSKRQDAAQKQSQRHPLDHSPAPAFAGLPERRGILPPVPLDLPFGHDSLSVSLEARSRSSSARSYDSERPPSLVSDTGSSWSISQPASASGSPTSSLAPPLLSFQHPDAYPGCRMPGPGSEHQARWPSTVPQPGAYCPNTTPTSPFGSMYSAAATFPHDHPVALPPLQLPQAHSDSYYYEPNSSNKPGCFGPVRRSSEILQPGGLSPQSPYARTAPTTPTVRATSSRWEPYPTRRPSTTACQQQQLDSGMSTKGSLSFLLN
jgi:Myb-like DNA-binding protein FlbD